MLAFRFDLLDVPFGGPLTVHSGVVGLHVGALDLAIFNHQCITLATVLAEDGGALEGEVEVFVELTGWIAQEADLRF